MTPVQGTHQDPGMERWAQPLGGLNFKGHFELKVTNGREVAQIVHEPSACGQLS